MEYFKEDEFADFSKMDPEFIFWLDDLREEYGKPIRINSSYRSADHNRAVGGVSNSAHTEVPCKAVDIHCDNSRDRFMLVAAAISLGCTRIGVNYEKNFVHLDFSSKRPWYQLWGYKSKKS